MERLVKGTVVIVPFPFADLSGSKKRPTLVVANLTGDDYVVCEITTVPVIDKYVIELNTFDFAEGGLNKKSRIRPNKLFTIDSSIIQYTAGVIKGYKIKEVEDVLVKMFQE